MTGHVSIRLLFIPLAALLLTACAGAQLHRQVLGKTIDGQYSDILREHSRTCAVRGCTGKITGHLTAPHTARTDIVYRLPACRMHMDRVRDYTLAMVMRQLAEADQPPPPMPPTPLLLTASALDESKLIVTPPTHVLVREARMLARDEMPEYRIVQGPIEMIDRPSDEETVEVIEDPADDGAEGTEEEE